MIRQDKRTFADGTCKTQVRVIQSYRPYPGQAPKHRTIRNFGYLEDQSDLDTFWNEVNACNSELRGSITRMIPIPISDRIDFHVQQARNYGWRFVTKAYSEIVANMVFGSKELGSTFQYLVADQLLNADGVRESLGRIPFYYGADAAGIDSKQFYQAIGMCGESFFTAQKSISERLSEVTGESLVDLLLQPADCYRVPDGRRRATPAMQLSLMLDPSHNILGLAAFSLDDSTDMLQTVDAAKAQMAVPELLLVTNGPVDAELLHSGHCGVLTSRPCTDTEAAEIRTMMENPDGRSEFRTWKLIDLPSESFRIDDSAWQKALLVENLGSDWNRPGSVLILTNEASMQANEILDLFDKLKRVDSSLRDVKVDYDARTAFVNDPQRIRGYSLALVTGLVIARLIQKRMGHDKIPVDRIKAALREANCIVLDKGGYVMLLDMAKSGCADDYALIQKCFGTDFYYSFAKQETFNRFFADMKLLTK